MSECDRLWISVSRTIRTKVRVATDYGDDVASTESHAVGTEFDPRMSARLKRAGLIFGVVLLVWLSGGARRSLLP